METIDKLVVSEHPLKQTPLKLVFSDLVYFLSCKNKKMSMQAYRREIEEDLLAQGRVDRKRSHVLMRSQQ